MTGITFRPIAELVEPVATWNPLRDEHEDTFFYVDLSAVDQELKQITGAREVICAEAPSRARQIVRAGDILVSTVRPNLNGVAKVTEELDSATASTGFCVLRPNSALLDSSFLFHWVKSPQFVSDMVNKATGASYPAVSDKIVMASPMPFVSVTEQRRIAAILDQVDALRAKRREALARLDSLTQSIFIEMFGGANAIHEKWQVKPLGDLLDFLTSGSRGWAEYYSEEGALFLRIQNVCRDELNLNDVAYVSAPDSAEARRTAVQEGDVLLSITADLGRTAVVPKGIGKAHINQHLSILRTKGVVPRYLSAFIQSPAGQREVMGRNKQGVKAGLNFDDIRSFRIPLPPKSLQHDFLCEAEKIISLRAIHAKSLAEMDSLFASLQHRAFRGEL